MTRVRGAWGNLPRRAQLAIAGVGLVTLVIIYLVFRAATSVTYQPVTGPEMSGDKLGQAQDIIEKAGYKTRMSADGKAVEVPAADANKAMSALTAGGLSARVDCNGGEKKMFSGTSAEFARDQNSCLQDMLVGVIQQNDAIKPGSAVVLIKAQDSDYFASEAAPATASVSYETIDGKLPEKTVKGIRQTVAGSTAGLKAEDVTVVDNTAGAQVGGPGMESEGGQRMSKLDAENNYNAMMEAKLTAAAADIVGANNVKVQSNVELDWDEIDRVVRQVGGPDGEQGPVSAEVLADEVLAGASGDGIQGVTGTGANIGVDPADRRTVTLDDPTTATAGDGSYFNKNNQVTYDNPFTNEQIKVAVGDIVRFRFAVTVDDDVDPDSAAAVRDSVKTLMGGNAADSFFFAQAPLAIANTKPADAAGASRTAAIMGYIKWALLGFALLALAFVMRRSLTQRTAELLNPADDLLLLEPGFEPIPLAELEAALAAGSASQGTPQRELHRKVEEIAVAKPQDVANELRRWMHQDEPNYATPTRR